MVSDCIFHVPLAYKEITGLLGKIMYKVPT